MIHTHRLCKDRDGLARLRVLCMWVSESITRHAASESVTHELESKGSLKVALFRRRKWGP